MTGHIGQDELLSGKARQGSTGDFVK